MDNQTKQSLDAVFEIIPNVSESIEVLPSSQEIAISPTGSQSLQTSDDEETHEEKIAKEDFEFSRGAIKSIAEDAQTTLHRAVDVAQQTDTPRAFEAVAEMIKATLAAHQELQTMHKTAAETRLATKAAQAPPAGSVNIQQGVVFSGTSEELLRLIAKDRQ